LYKGLVAELGYERFSGTLLFTRIEKEAKAVEADPIADPSIEASDAIYALYAFAGEGRVAITDNLNLRAAYVRAWEDYHSLVIDEEDDKPYVDQVISLGGDFSFGEGWKVDGEFAKWTNDDLGLLTEGTAANLNLTGVIGPVELAGEFVRVEDGYDPEFVLTDEDDDDGLETNVKTIGVSAKAKLIEALTLTGGYKITGDADNTADWDYDKHAIAEVGAAYELAWGGLTLTPSVDLKHSSYILYGTKPYLEDKAVLETTVAVAAEFEPIEATFTHVDARIKEDSYEAYFKKNKLELAADYDLSEAFNVHGGYTWDKQDVADAYVGFDKKKDTHTSKFNVGAEAGFAVYEGINLNASYDYAVMNNHIEPAWKPYTKSILTAGADAQVTPKSNISGKAEYHKLDRYYSSVQYDYAPVTNIIGEVNYKYDITTNTLLKLGYKVIKSDVENVDHVDEYDYLARIITGSLKVTF
jgi:hypothetical protein